MLTASNLHVQRSKAIFPVTKLVGGLDAEPD